MIQQAAQAEARAPSALSAAVIDNTAPGLTDALIRHVQNAYATVMRGSIAHVELTRALTLLGASTGPRPTVQRDDLARYEGFIGRLTATWQLKTGLAYDDADVRNELRVAVQRALQKWRAEPRPTDVDDERRYVNRAVKNALVDMVRKADRRRLDVKSYASIQAGTAAGLFDTAAPDFVTFVETTVEEIHLSQERDGAIQRAAGVLEQRLGADSYHEALARADGESWASIVPDDERNAASCRYRRVLAKARRILSARTLGEVEQRYGGAVDARQIDTLTDDDLARVAFVHGVEVTRLERANLLATVRELNNGSPEFPPCFGDAKEYDPKVSACNQECDFRLECAATLPEHRSASVEQRLVQLKTKAAPAAPPPAPAKVVVAKPPKPNAIVPDASGNAKLTTLPEPAATAHDVVVGSLWTSNDSRGPSRTVVVREILKKEQRAQVMNVASGAKTKVQLVAFNAKGSKGWTFAGMEPQPTPLAVAAPTKSTGRSPKVDEVKVDKPAGADTPKGKKPKTPKTNATAGGLFLSNRRGVLPKGKKAYTLRPDGKRWYRKPQGSAAELANCPVGCAFERAWAGYLYHVTKIEDGRIVEHRKTGMKHKRDGVWRLEWREKLTADGKPTGKRDRFKKPMEATLGQITFHITKNKAWSAARFFGVLPTTLKAGGDPAKFKPESFYVYGGKDAPPAKEPAKSKVAPKPKVKPVKKPAKKAKKR